MENKKEKFNQGVMNIISQFAVSDAFKSPLVGAFTLEKEENYQLLYLIYPDWNEHLDMLANHGRIFHQIQEETDIFLKAYALKKDFIVNCMNFLPEEKITIWYDRDGILTPPKEKEYQKRK